MHRRPTIYAALAAGGLALTAVVTAAAPAAASTAGRESCSIHARAGVAHVTADFHGNGLTKTGFVFISTNRPFLIITDRVAWQRGAAGMVSGVRSWTVRYPVGYYSHAHVILQGTDGVRVGCTTR